MTCSARWAVGTARVTHFQDVEQRGDDLLGDFVVVHNQNPFARETLDAAGSVAAARGTDREFQVGKLSRYPAGW